MTQAPVLSSAALAYLAEVGQALRDLAPTDRGELLDEVQEHLLSITEDEPELALTTDALVAHLGSPATYAAQLRGAAGLTSSGATRLEVSPPVAALVVAAAGYLRSLAPAWWLARGYLAAGLLITAVVPVSETRATGWNPTLFGGAGGPGGGIAGGGPYLVVVIAVFILASIIAGTRHSQANRWIWLIHQAFTVAGVTALVYCPMWWVGPSLYGYFRGRYGSG